MNGPAPYSQKGNNMPVKIHIFVFFGIYTNSGPTSFFHSFAISIIECDYFLCLFLEFLGLFCFNLYFRYHFVWILTYVCSIVDLVL